MTNNALSLIFYQIAATGVLPARWFEPALPPPETRAARTGRLHLEVVSHCWQYSHLLIYQLSSLVLCPPRDIDITLTVCFCEEDEATVALLRFFANLQVPGVHWRWQPMARQHLLRRSIGRNSAALNTSADWVWFTDCDVLFRDGCLDMLAGLLQGRQEALFYPDEERCTDLLKAEDALLETRGQSPAVLDIDADIFTSLYPTRATGPLQIVHGDVCRAVGYCRRIGVYQTPVERFAKCHEDRAFRWLLRTQGEPLRLPGVYRIRHLQKGRYSHTSPRTRWRMRWRALQNR